MFFQVFLHLENQTSYFEQKPGLIQLSSKAPPKKKQHHGRCDKTYKITTGCPYTVCCSCGSISMSKSDSSPSPSEEPLSTQSETSRNEPPKNGRRNSNHGHIATMLRATKGAQSALWSWYCRKVVLRTMMRMVNSRLREDQGISQRVNLTRVPRPSLLTYTFLHLTYC